MMDLTLLLSFAFLISFAVGMAGSLSFSVMNQKLTRRDIQSRVITITVLGGSGLLLLLALIARGGML